MSTKIQINSLAALERLIGNDNELEIEIRQSVVEAFTRKHLKNIASQSFVSDIGKAINNEIKDEFLTELKSGWSTNYVLKDKAKELIEERISLITSGAISEAVLEHFNSLDLQKVLEEQTKWVANELTSSKLSERFDRMVDTEIKRRLNIK